MNIQVFYPRVSKAVYTRVSGTEFYKTVYQIFDELPKVDYIQSQLYRIRSMLAEMSAYFYVIGFCLH